MLLLELRETAGYAPVTAREYGACGTGRLRRFIEFAHTTVVLTISVTHEIMRRALYLEELLRSHEHTRALKMIPVGKWFDEPIDA